MNPKTVSIGGIIFLILFIIIGINGFVSYNEAKKPVTKTVYDKHVVKYVYHKTCTLKSSMPKCRIELDNGTRLNVYAPIVEGDKLVSRVNRKGSRIFFRTEGDWLWGNFIGSISDHKYQ